MSIPDSRKRGETRRRIIASAVSLFAEQGFDRTTIVEIERAAGLSPGSGSLYRHFKSKDDVLLAAVRQYRTELAQLSDRIDFSHTRSVQEALQRAAMLLVSFVAARGDIMRVFAVEGLLFPRDAREEIAAAWKDGYGLVADFIRSVAAPDVLEEHDITALAIQMLGSASHYFGQTTAFTESSLPMSFMEYMGSWISTWSVVLEGRARP